MLVGNSRPEYAFTRLAIWGLRLVAPASIAYSAIIFLQPGHGLLQASRLAPIHLWMFGEAAFFLGIFLPCRAYLQRPAAHPPPPSKLERERLLERVKDNVAEPDLYLSKWFMNAKIEDIRRENLKEFFAWSLMHEQYELIDEHQDAELEGYVDELERTFNREFGEGRGNARALRGTFDPVPMQHRPLLWYGIVLVVDIYSSCRLWWSSYKLYRQPGLGALTMLPQRWHTLLVSRVSRSSPMSYWYREHTSRNRLPILFIHGIGIGIFAYVNFLGALAAESTMGCEEDDGQVGIIALEVFSISSRICPHALDSAEMREEIHKILNAHGWTDFVLAAHSYGTAIASSMLQHVDFKPRIKAAVLMDPICFALHLPDVCFNFTRRKPSRANERMLYYFASQDMMISHTLSRHFFWSEYILWKDDVAALPLTVTLSGKDLIVPREAVWKYLTDIDTHGMAAERAHDVGQRTKHFEQDLLKVLWFDDFDHAGLFASKGACRAAARAVSEYTKNAADADLLP